jgi:hypothetical protein
MEANGQFHAPAALPRGTPPPPFQLYWRLSDHRAGLDALENIKIFCPC